MKIVCVVAEVDQLNWLKIMTMSSLGYWNSLLFNREYELAREILYKGKDQIAWKQLWRPEGRQLNNMHKFVQYSK